MSDFDLFVIGGGSAGVRCARIAAGHGARVGVAEDRHWGGTCVNIGCVPKKMLVQAGEYGGWADDARGFGWNITKGAHDWPHLIAAKDAEIDRLQGIYRRLLDGAGATIFDGRATLVDATTVAIGDARVTADTIVVATGGVPVRPAIPGAHLGIVSDDAFYLPRLPRRVALIGGGYIAVEFAGIFAGLGAEVDLIYRQPLPLRGFDEDLRTALAEALAAQGVRLHAGAAPRAIAEDGPTKTVTLDDGRTIDTDLVFFAVGRAPATRDLGLDRAGVAVSPMGAVVIDAGLRTSQPHIYAIGDVTDRLNLTPVATAEGHALADTLFGARHGHAARTISLHNVATAVFSTPPIGTVGLTEAQAAHAGPADIYVSRFTPMRHTISRRARRSMMKLVVDARTDVVLGAHMLGEDAPEILQGFSVAIGMGATKADFDRTIGIHPTAAEEFVQMRTPTRRVGEAATAAAAQ